MSETDNQAQTQPSQSGDLLDALAQVESHIRALKRAQTEQQQASDSVQNQRLEIQARLSAFEAERNKVHAREGELVDRGRELDQQRGEIDRQRHEMRMQIEGLERQKQEIESRARQVETAGSDRERQLSRLSEALDKQMNEIDRRESELNELRGTANRVRELEVQIETRENQIEELTQRSSGLEEVRGRATEMQRQLEESSHEMHELHERIAAAGRAAETTEEEHRAELEEARVRLERFEADLEDAKAACIRGAEDRARLEELEAQLSQTSGEREQADQAASQREAELRQTAERLENELNEAREASAEFERSCASFEARVQELEAMNAESAERVERSEGVVGECRARIESLENQLNDSRATADSFVSAGEEYETRIAELQGRFTQSQEESEQMRSRVGELEAELGEARELAEGTGEETRGFAERVGVLERELSEAREFADRAGEESQGFSARISELEAELSETRQRAEGSGEESSGLYARISELEAELDRARAGAEDAEFKTSEMNAEIERLRGELAAAEDVGTEMTQKCEEMGNLVKQFEAQIAEGNADTALTDRIAQLETELEDVNACFASDRAAFESAAEEMTARIEALSEKTRTLEAQVAEGVVDVSMVERVSQLETELNDAGERFETERSGFEQTVERLQAQLSESGGCECGPRIEELESVVESLTSELEAARVSGVSEGSGEDSEWAIEAREKIEELSGLLEHRNQAIEQLAVRIKAAEANAGSEDAAEQVAQAQARADEAEARVAELGDQLEALRLDLSQRKSEMGDDWSQSRRQRLRLYRGLLRKQSEKVRRASEALRGRYAECEKLLSRRSELASAYQKFNQERERMVKHEVRSSAILVLAGIVGVIAMVAGVSWFVAGQAAPGQYAARTAVVADGGRRALTDGETQSWQTYSESLISDPAFMDIAADRMKQRGIVSLGSPGALSQRVKQDMTFQSPAPGRLELELVGDGPVKTERVLDTFVVAMSSYANQSRTRRREAATTQVIEPARAMSRPLDKTRLYAAGGIFLGGLLVAFGLGAVVWKRLAESKSKFERNKKIDSVLDDSSWADPRQAA